MQLTNIDWIILAVVGLSSLLALTRGFLREAISLFSWAAAFVIAGKFHEQVAKLLTFFNDEMTRTVLSVLGLFLGTLLVTSLIGNLATSLMSKAGLSYIDRLLGMVFGLLRGILVLAAVLAFMQILFRMHILSFMAEASWFKDSLFIPELSRIVNWFFVYMSSATDGSASSAAAAAVDAAVNAAQSAASEVAASGEGSI